MTDVELEFEDVLAHYGVKGMKWGVRKSPEQLRASGKAKLDEAKLAVRSKVFAVGFRVQPREMSYALKRALNDPSADDKALSAAALLSAKSTGGLPSNQKLSNAIEKMGIEKHKNAVYDLDDADIGKFKKYTDSAWYSRNINSYLATGEPKQFGNKAHDLKSSLSKGRVTDTTVFRSTSLNFSFNGVAKKLENMSEEELSKSFDSFSKNYKGKSFKENRVFSTSTSPNFAIDTWRKVNPNAAASYNTYMIIHTKNTPGVLADGKTKSGKKLVNTRANQEAILAPTRMRYESLSYDQERGMFAITVTALGDDDE